MKSPSTFIVRPLNGRRYDNIKNIGGLDLITSVSKEDHESSNRYAEVIETPINYSGEIVKGDVLIVHHNVFKFYYDMKGNEKSGASFFKDDLFFVDYEQFFLYKHKDNDWKSHSKYCFVKPIKTIDSTIKKNCEEEPLFGTIEYINDELISLGLSVGDKISFEPNSEYPFTIENKKMYRMFTNNITVKWN